MELCQASVGGHILPPIWAHLFPASAETLNTGGVVNAGYSDGVISARSRRSDCASGEDHARLTGDALSACRVRRDAASITQLRMTR